MQNLTLSVKFRSYRPNTNLHLKTIAKKTYKAKRNCMALAIKHVVTCLDTFFS